MVPAKEQGYGEGSRHLFFEMEDNTSLFLFFIGLEIIIRVGKAVLHSGLGHMIAPKQEVIPSHPAYPNCTMTAPKSDRFEARMRIQALQLQWYRLWFCGLIRREKFSTSWHRVRSRKK
jgi:hypothetical protein